MYYLPFLVLLYWGWCFTLFYHWPEKLENYVKMDDLLKKIEDWFEGQPVGPVSIVQLSEEEFRFVFIELLKNKFPNLRDVKIVDDLGKFNIYQRKV